MSESGELRMTWRGKQSDALLDTTRYLDIEGAIRSSKTTIGLHKVLSYCTEFPGIRCLVSRWTDDDVKALIQPLLRDLLERTGTQFKWFPDEHRYELGNGSWIYIRGLRPSESGSRFSKFRGMTLAVVWVDQTEEIPEDFALELKGRLSQPGYPHQLIFTPNPPGEDHWLAKMFPDPESGQPENPEHKLIRLSLFDNRHNLDPGYVEQLQIDYPEGHPMRRRLIEGRRGLAVSGKPVYAGYFDRKKHVMPCIANADLPLVECIDFGHHHPCVVWLQFQPWGELTVLGGVMGEDVFIEDFAPMIKQYRAQWFPEAPDVMTCCDPAGSHENSQGTRKNGVYFLKESGIYPRWVANSNMPEVRDYAIQTIAGYMRRSTVRGEGFHVDPQRWMIVSAREARHASYAIDAFEAGYVFDERLRRTAGGKTLALPLKDGYYEHCQNCLEYGILNFGPAKPTVAQERSSQMAVERARTARDHDPMDVVRRGGRAGSRMRRPGGF